MYKIIKIPESVSIALVGRAEPVLFTFQEFLRGRLNDSVWGRSLESLEMRAAILAAFEDAQDEVKLRRGDWEILASCTRNPSPPYLTEVIGQAMSFLYAIINARDEA